MSDLNEARKLVYDKFIADWADETIYDLDNDKFDIPEGDISWLRLVVRNKVGTQDTLGKIGSRKFLRDATVMVQVFTELDTGTSEGDRLSTKVRGIFEGIRLNGLWFFASDIQEIGSDGTFFQHNVECTFNYEETK